MANPRLHPARLAGAACLALLVFLPAASAELGVPPVAGDDLARQAALFEARGDWPEACRCYDELCRRERSRADYRAAYQRCLRRVHLARRHRDPSYRQMLGRLSAPQALDLYEQVLARVAGAYVDRGRTDVGSLFRSGVAELRLALSDAAFRRDYLAGTPAGVDALLHRLDEWDRRTVASRTEAREQVLAVARAAQDLGVAGRPVPLAVLFALEFASGACNGLDEFSLFLTPAGHAEVQASLRGRFVGVGLDLAVVDRKLEVVRVYPNSPAAEAGVLRRDRILRIDGQPVAGSPPELAADRLRGEAGTTVELEVLSPGHMTPAGYRLVRRPVVAPSVDHEALLEDDGTLLGWVRLLNFQDTTAQEVKEALAQLQTLGARALILDLRGNPGGAFRSAVQVAELFLGEGVIAHVQSPLREYNRPFRADIANPVPLPLVVLIDGDTASSAEVVAGALREHGRCVLVGQGTFGKGSVQCVLPLDRGPLEKAPAGLRLTVARFYSPSRVPYAGRGVTPDVAVEPEGDAALAAARQEARRLAALPPMMPVR